MKAPVIQQLTGDRLHLSHGPIDVILKADGPGGQLAIAYQAAIARFETILFELCAELPLLRTPVGAAIPVSSVGRRMTRACLPFSNDFITPMAAVAGSVADELLAVMRAAAALERAYVNDGGDIAVYCEPGRHLDVAIAADFAKGAIPAVNGTIRISGTSGIGGIATSGAQGRSFSLGIADSVTVLAETAAAADAAATMIANAVNIEHDDILRRPAWTLDPDSDLGSHLVTLRVPVLTRSETDRALAAGLLKADDFRLRGLIRAAALQLQGECRITGQELTGLQKRMAS